MRTITTENPQHASQVARALLVAAEGDRAKVRTVTGPNGLNAFEVDDDFPDVEIPKPDEGPGKRRGRREPEEAPPEAPEQQDEQPKEHKSHHKK